MSLRDNKKRWLFEGFFEHERPNLNCPKCNIGELMYKKDWAKIEEDSNTKLTPSTYFYYQNEGKKVEYFCGFSICSNAKCQEPISINGLVNYRISNHKNEFLNKYYRFFIPKFFFPAISIINIGKNCPPDIKAQIEKSFSHFFNDKSACANSIRTSLELILNNQKIHKTYITSKHERRIYSLHERIGLFGKNYPDLKPFLLATKWIGNAGSHINEITKEAILDGYELLEYCLDELYEKKSRIKDLKKKVKIINKTKKPLINKLEK